MNRAFFVAALLALSCAAPSARADIFQWEYINPADPSQGKQQSTTLAPDGAGVDAVPGAILAYRDLTMANLVGADLMNVYGTSTNLTNADLSQANLSNANLQWANLTDATLRQANLTNASLGATLTGADFTGAEVRGASFGGSFTLAQLYSTASYQAHDLSGVQIRFNNLARGNFTGQNLTNVDFGLSTLTDADFTAAQIRGALLGSVSLAQLYSTASYKEKDLTGVNLDLSNFAGGNFAGQNLTNASFSSANLINVGLNRTNLTGASLDNVNLTSANLSQANLTNAVFWDATLTGANFTGAQVRGANFVIASASGTGITLAQLYSTVSYRAHDLTGMSLWGNNLGGGNFVGQNLTNAEFGTATLTGANFREANLTSTRFGRATLRDADFREANLANTVFSSADLTGATFAGQNLANTYFGGTTLTGADFTDADVRGADLSTSSFTLAQLYSTASYQAHDLTGIRLYGDLSRWNFARQKLTNADFYGATLTDADFTGAEVRGARFFASYDYNTSMYVGGITLSQLYSTVSYQAHDLTGVGLGINDLSGGNFVGQNLTNAEFGGATLTGADFREANLTNAAFGGATLTGADFREANLTNAGFYYATLTDADFTNAEVRGASFGYATLTGFTAAQLYSTASYQAHDLSGIGLSENDLTGWNFAGQNLTNSTFGARYLSAESYSTLTGADFTGADTRGARYLKLSDAITTNLIHPNGHIDGLNLAAGEKLTAYAGVPIPVHVSGNVSIAPTATFDLTDNDLIVRATAQTKDALHAEIQARITSAQNGVDANRLTNWNGTGITSSTARATNVAGGRDIVGLGVIRNSDLDITTGIPGSTYTSFGGQPVTPDDVLVKYTYIGDGNLDGVVNFDDYAAMDNAFFGLIPNLGWATGDINFDGVINFDDYSKVDQAFFFQGAPLSGDANLAAVPEPATLFLIGIGLLPIVALSRRNRGPRRSRLAPSPCTAPTCNT